MMDLLALCRPAQPSLARGVTVVQSRDLNDPQAMRQQLKNVTDAMGRADLVG